MFDPHRHLKGLLVVLMSTLTLELLAATVYGQQQSGVFAIGDIQPGPRYRWNYQATSGAGRWAVRHGKFSVDGAAFFDADEKPLIAIGDYPGKDEVLEWSADTTHLIFGTNQLRGARFDSDSNYPLTFRLLVGKGYVYLCGRGTVTTKDGKTTRLGFNDSVDSWLPFLTSEDLMRAEAAAQALGYLANTEELKDKVVPALITAARSNTFVYWYACEALGRLGDKRALEVLRELRAKGGPVGALARESIINIAPPAMPAKSTLSYAIGMSIGKELTNATKRLQLIIDTDTMLGAMRDVLDGKPTHMTEKELEEIGRAATAPTRKNADNEETKARGDAATSMPDKSKLSYAIGMSFGREATSRFMTHQFPVDTGTVLEALRDVVDGKPARLTEQELSDILDQRSDAIQARRKPQK